MENENYNMIHFSIIVPVYNASKTLGLCIESIINISNDNLEVIIVDDGSTDDSYRLCCQFSRKDERVKVLHQENQGQGAARNLGLKYAKGEYILFCDADDRYDTDSLQKLFENLEVNMSSYDLLVFNYRNVWNGALGEESAYNENNIMFKSEKEKIKFYSGKISHEVCGYSVCNKVYKKSIIDEFEITFPERAYIGNHDDWAEDLAFNLLYGAYITTIKVIKAPIYLISKHGTKGEMSENSLSNRIDHMTRILKFVEPYWKHIGNDEFSQVFVWQIRRYIYIQLGYVGVEALRRQILASECRSYILSHMRKVAYNKEYFSMRWDKKQSSEYRSILRYLLNGRLVVYKIRTFWIWKIMR